MDEEDERFSNSEYTKVVVKALQDAIEVNDKVIFSSFYTIFSNISNFSKIF